MLRRRNDEYATVNPTFQGRRRKNVPADQGTSASVGVGIEDDDATTSVLTAPAGDLPEVSGGNTLTLTLERALV